MDIDEGKHNKAGRKPIIGGILPHMSLMGARKNATKAAAATPKPAFSHEEVQKGAPTFASFAARKQSAFAAQKPASQKPAPKLQPVRKPVPEPQPARKPSPMQQPARKPSPTPQPAPKLQLVRKPVPEPQPSSAPQPARKPSPTPQPAPEQVQANSVQASGTSWQALSHESLRILSPEELAKKLTRRPKKVEDPTYFGGLHRQARFKSTLSHKKKQLERAKAAVSKGNKKREAKVNEFRAKGMDVLFEAMDRLDDEQGIQNQFPQGANVEDDEYNVSIAASRADDKALYESINETISDLEESLSKDYAEFQRKLGMANGEVQEQQGADNAGLGLEQQGGDNGGDAGLGLEKQGNNGVEAETGDKGGEAGLGPETVDSDDELSFATVHGGSGSWDI